MRIQPQNAPQEPYVDPRVTVLSPANGFSGLDADGRRISLTRVDVDTSASKGSWTPIDGWILAETELPAEVASRLQVVVEGAEPTMLEAYTMDGSWTSLDHGTVNIELDGFHAARCAADLVVSDKPWHTSGTWQNGKATGSLAKLGDLYVGRPLPKPGDRQWLSLRIPEAQHPDIELSFKFEATDRSRLQRRVMFLLASGRIVPATQWETMSKDGKPRETWRARVGREGVVQAFVQERASQFVQIRGIQPPRP